MNTPAQANMTLIGFAKFATRTVGTQKHNRIMPEYRNSILYICEFYKCWVHCKDKVQ